MISSKLKFPKLLSSKELKEKGLLKTEATNGTHSTPVATEEVAPKAAPAPAGILCYFAVENELGLLADGTFKLLHQLFKLLDALQPASKDGLSGLPLRIYPQFEQKEEQIGLRLCADENLLQKTELILRKINTHLTLLAEGKANINNLPQRYASLYVDFLKSLRSYRQKLCIHASDEAATLLLSLDYSLVDSYLEALAKIQQEKTQVSMQGQITGFSKNQKTVDFQILSRVWNGIRTEKAVHVPISCQGDAGLVEFAQSHLDNTVEIEAYVTYDHLGQAHYHLVSISVQTAKGRVSQKIVHTGPRGGQFYLTYKGKRIYLSRGA